MNTLKIPIEVIQPSTGMAQAVLTELAEHLDLLAKTGKTHVIDLNSLPMNITDKQELQHFLGQGEVNITLITIGDSKIFETAYSGIWWIKHYSADEKFISEFLEVTSIPEIIKSHVGDIQQAANELKSVINHDEERMYHERR